MARPLELIVEELLDYIEQASTYTRGLTFEQYSSDRKTQRAVGAVHRGDLGGLTLHLAPLEAAVRAMAAELPPDDPA